jgi:3-(3-hydroxy-phenyl)propionate hydroxylase
VLRGTDRGWLLEHLGGSFVLLRFAGPAETPSPEGRRSPHAASPSGAVLREIVIVPPGQSPTTPTDLVDDDGVAARRYDALPGTAYLFRPDQHVAARWRCPDDTAVDTAVRRALAR